MSAPVSDLVARLRAEVAFQQGDAAAWGVDTYGDLPRTLALLNEAAARISELEAVLADARAANERDRTEVCIAVNALTDAFARRDWLIRGGRGSYEWDDDRFRDEFRDAMAEFEPHVQRLRKIGADRSNCPETQAEVLAARRSLTQEEKRPLPEKERNDG